MSLNIVAIVQARLGSSRLPLKSLLSLRGTPIIDWVISRLGKSRKLSKIIVAIPDTPLDEVLATHLDKQGVDWIKGSENDVLGRFHKASISTSADLVVRICADNPLVWWEAVDRLVEFYESANVDYAYNHIPQDNLWPDGLGAEIISAGLLQKLHEVAKTPSQREHCLNYIRENPGKFRIGTFNPVEPWLARPDLKLDVDTIEDYRKLSLANITPESSAREIVASFSTRDRA